MVETALEAVRTHLDMSVAYLSEFVGDRSVFRAVNAPGLEHLIKPGDSRPIQDIYCQHILDGRLPRLIPDTSAEPLAMAMPITRDTPIGSHVSVPIHRQDGSVYGMFCCLDPTPKASLNDRDLKVMESFARLAADRVATTVERRERRERLMAQITGVIAGDGFDVWLQPIMGLDTGRVMGFEALSRFRSEPYRTPDVWFADADEVGLGIELEVAAIAAALDLLPAIPIDAYLSINASPATAGSDQLLDMLDGRPGERLVLEITEHSAVEDYDMLAEAATALRFKGIRIAVDDAGAGYAGLSHIVRLAPDMIKLDMSLVRGIDADPARRALCAAMLHFARDTGASIVAEGIETAGERDTLRRLGVGLGQGYLLGRPVPWSDTIGPGEAIAAEA